MFAPERTKTLAPLETVVPLAWPPDETSRLPDTSTLVKKATPLAPTVSAVPETMVPKVWPPADTVSPPPKMVVPVAMPPLTSSEPPEKAPCRWREPADQHALLAPLDDCTFRYAAGGNGLAAGFEERPRDRSKHRVRSRY